MKRFLSAAVAEATGNQAIGFFICRTKNACKFFLKQRNINPFVWLCTPKLELNRLPWSLVVVWKPGPISTPGMHRDHSVLRCLIDRKLFLSVTLLILSWASTHRLISHSACGHARIAAVRAGASTSTTSEDPKSWVIVSILTVNSCLFCLIAFFVIAFLVRVPVCTGTLTIGYCGCRIATHFRANRGTDVLNKIDDK